MKVSKKNLAKTVSLAVNDGNHRQRSRCGRIDNGHV